MLAMSIHYAPSSLELARAYRVLALNHARNVQNKAWCVEAAYWYKVADLSEVAEVKVSAADELAHVVEEIAIGEVDARIEQDFFSPDGFEPAVIYRRLGDAYRDLVFSPRRSVDLEEHRKEWYAKAAYWYMKVIEREDDAQVRNMLVFLALIQKEAYQMAEACFAARDIRDQRLQYLGEAPIRGINSGITGRGCVLKPAALNEAVCAPGRFLFGRNISPTIEEKAAVFVYALSQGHPFEDGNKRTAYSSLKAFLHSNGFDIVPGAEDKVKELIGRCVDVPPIGTKDLSLAFHDLLVGSETKPASGKRGVLGACFDQSYALFFQAKKKPAELMFLFAVVIVTVLVVTLLKIRVAAHSRPRWLSGSGASSFDLVVAP